MSKYKKEEKVWAEGNKLEGEGRNEKRERKGEKKRKPTLNLIKPENSKKKRWSFGFETSSFWTRELQKKRWKNIWRKKSSIRY
jgi:hypothetical protein